MIWPPVPPPAMRTRNCDKSDLSEVDYRLGQDKQVLRPPWRTQDVNSRFHSIFSEVLSRTPMPARVKKSDVPPEVMSGSGSPLVGTSDITTLMFNNALSRMAIVVPNSARRADP